MATLLSSAWSQWTSQDNAKTEFVLSMVVVVSHATLVYLLYPVHLLSWKVACLPPLVTLLGPCWLVRATKSIRAASSSMKENEAVEEAATGTTTTTTTTAPAGEEEERGDREEEWENEDEKKNVLQCTHYLDERPERTHSCNCGADTSTETISDAGTDSGSDTEYTTAYASASHCQAPEHGLGSGQKKQTKATTQTQTHTEASSQELDDEFDDSVEAPVLPFLRPRAPTMDHIRNNVIDGGRTPSPLTLPRVDSSRSWGVLPVGGHRRTRSTFSTGTSEDLGYEDGTLLRSASMLNYEQEMRSHTLDPYSPGSPASPGFGVPGRMTRNVSCSSAFDVWSSELDTPLQTALSNLVNIKAVLMSIDPSVIAAALHDLDGPTGRERSPSSVNQDPSSSSSTVPVLTRLQRSKSIGTASPSSMYRRKNRLGSPQPPLSRVVPNLLRAQSSTSLSSYIPEGRSTSFGADTDFEQENFEDMAPGSGQDDCDIRSQLDSQYGASCSFGNMETFSPLQAIDQAIDALLDPENLMRPVVAEGDANLWLDLVAGQHGPSPPPPPQSQHSRPLSAESRQAGGVYSRRERLSSDDLAAAVVSPNGCLVVEVPVEGLSGTEASSTTQKSGTRTSKSWSGGSDDEFSASSISDSGQASRQHSTGSLFASESSSGPSVDRKVAHHRDSFETKNGDSRRISTEKDHDGKSKVAVNESEFSEHLEQQQQLPQQAQKRTILRLNSDISESPRSPTISSDASTDGSTSSLNPFILSGCLEDWHFDALAFGEETGGRPLYTLLWALFNKENYLSKFKIDRHRFKALCKELEFGYKDLPYHNSMHAADVLKSMHYMLFNMDLHKALTDIESMAALFAAAVHDIGHPGLNNNFLTKTRHQLSFIYNDRSILEQFHLTEAFRLLSIDRFNILENLSSEEYTRFRHLTIEAVIATDLKFHFQTVTKLRMLRSSGETDFVNPSNSEVIVKMAIKVADIGHTTKTFALHKKWSDLIQEELCIQGDKERSLGLQVSEFMDRETVNPVRNQHTFLEHICLPLLESVRGVLPSFAPIHRQCRANHRKWLDLAEGVES